MAELRSQEIGHPYRLSVLLSIRIRATRADRRRGRKSERRGVQRHRQRTAASLESRRELLVAEARARAHRYGIADGVAWPKNVSATGARRLGHRLSGAVECARGIRPGCARPAAVAR